MLTIQNLNKNFGKKKAVRDFTYNFEKGTYGLLGPNGSGKTTLLRCITNLYNVPDNTIFYQDKCINKSPKYLECVGYLPQKFGLFKDLKIIEMMQLLASLKNIDYKKSKTSIEECIDIVNLSDRINERVGNLSGGMVRRLGIAQALIGEPKIIIFDEPTVGLDLEERLRFKTILSKIKKDKIIILSTHIVEDVETVCDEILIMKEGNIVVSGNCSDIQEIAKGKTYIISEEEQGLINGNYIIQSRKEDKGKIILKFISSNPQLFEVANPSIEDGYVCALKDI